MKQLLLFFFTSVLLLGFASASVSILLCDPQSGYQGLSGDISGNTITIYNTQLQPQEVGLAVYKKFDEVIGNQEIFDWDSDIVPAAYYEDNQLVPGSVELSVDVPACNYQIDSFCINTQDDTQGVLMSLAGYPETNGYHNRKIDWDHIDNGDYCEQEVPEFGLAAGLVVLGLAGLYILKKRN